MGRARYYTLIASLPHLPYFAKAKRLPINRERLNSRLRMLDETDRALIDRLAGFVRWERQGAERTDPVIVADYLELSRDVAGTPCAQLVEDAATERTVLVALRRRQLGRAAPSPDEPWGLGPWADTLRRNWSDPGFGLAEVFPWLPRARDLLDAGETLELERFLTGLAWDRLDRARPVDPFRFETLLVYLFQWNLLEQWLASNREAAETRFDELIAEAIGDQDEQLH